jgi:hypothetical protein
MKSKGSIGCVTRQSIWEDDEFREVLAAILKNADAIASRVICQSGDFARGFDTFLGQRHWTLNAGAARLAQLQFS